MEKHSSLMKNRIKLKSYYYCTGLVKWGEQFSTIILKQSLLTLRHSAIHIKGNEIFITEQINVNNSRITTGKNKKKSGKRKKFGKRLSGCCSSESAHLALWAVKLIPLLQNNMQLCYPHTVTRFTTQNITIW